MSPVNCTLHYNSKLIKCCETSGFVNLSADLKHQEIYHYNFFTFNLYLLLINWGFTAWLGIYLDCDRKMFDSLPMLPILHWIYLWRMHYLWIPFLSVVGIDRTIRGLEFCCPQTSWNSLIVASNSNLEDVSPLFEILSCKFLIQILSIAS